MIAGCAVAPSAGIGASGGWSGGGSGVAPVVACPGGGPKPSARAIAEAASSSRRWLPCVGGSGSDCGSMAVASASGRDLLDGPPSSLPVAASLSAAPGEALARSDSAGAALGCGFLGRRGRVVRQRPAKPCTPVRFRSSPQRTGPARIPFVSTAAAKVADPTGRWRSWLAHLHDAQGVGGSNPSRPTPTKPPDLRGFRRFRPHRPAAGNDT